MVDVLQLVGMRCVHLRMDSSGRPVYQQEWCHPRSLLCGGRGLDSILKAMSVNFSACGLSPAAITVALGASAACTPRQSQDRPWPQRTFACPERGYLRATACAAANDPISIGLGAPRMRGRRTGPRAADCA